MRKLDGFSLLTISICCCIFVSLGYVKLFHGVSQKVNKPDTAEFWQVRTLALNLRSPAKEARLAFREGNLHTFDTSSLTDSSDHKVAELAMDKKPGQSMATQAAFGFGWLSSGNDTVEQLQEHHARFIDSSSQFAMEYNRELTRLINSNR